MFEPTFFDDVSRLYQLAVASDHRSSFERELYIFLCDFVSSTVTSQSGEKVTLSKKR